MDVSDLIRSLSDFQPAEIAADTVAADALVRESCPKRATRVRSVPVTVALRRAETLVVRGAGRAAMRAFRADPAYDSLRKLRGLDAALAFEAVPLAQIAIALREHELAPRDPLPLVNVSALLSQAGLAQEALALLDSADRMPGRIPASMGLDGTAVALNNRGFALWTLGQFGAAARALDEAIAREPLLAEARANRSAVDVCTQPPTVLVANQGRYRAAPTTPPRGPTTPPPGPTTPPPLAHTVQVELATPPTYQVDITFPTPYPSYQQWYAGEEEPVNWDGPWGRLSDQLIADATAAALEGIDANERYRARPHGIWAKATLDAVLGELKPLRDEGQRLRDELPTALFDEVTSHLPLPPGACNAPTAYGWALQAYESHVGELQRFSREYANTAYSYAAAFADPDARALILAPVRATIADLQATMVGTFVGLGGDWFVEECGQPEAPPTPALGTSTVPDHPCPFTPKKWDVFGFVTIGLHCEEVSLDVHTTSKIPLQAFARWSKNFKDHTTTTVIGGRFKTPGVVKITAEAGVSITKSTRTGRITDASFVGSRKVELNPAATVKWVTKNPVVVTAATVAWQTFGTPTPL